MAVVKEYTLPSGAHIKICDDYYRNKTEEERKADREEADERIIRIIENHLRKL